MTSERFLLCRPQGGLNDMLCQIERCAAYGQRFGRTVVVDTGRPDDLFFRDVFDRYFRSLQAHLVLDPGQLGDLDLDRLKAFPRALTGRVSTYAARFEPRARGYFDSQSGEALTFDFSRDHDAALLIHHAHGGGDISIGALARMALQPALVEVIERRLGALGPRFAGVHVRNTDYRTAYGRIRLAGRIADDETIFLATDDRGVLAHLRGQFGAERVVSFATLPDPAVGPLHHWRGADPFVLNTDAIADLVILGRASRLYLFQLDENRFGSRLSGFSVLAASLNKRPALVETLLGRT